MASVVDESELKPLVRCSNYRVVRNDADCYTFLIEPRIMDEKDGTKFAWCVEAKEVEVSVRDGMLILDGPQAQKECSAKSAFLELPKTAQHAVHEVDAPPNGGVLVTVLKVGAKQVPGAINPSICGRGQKYIRGPDGQDWSLYMVRAAARHSRHPVHWRGCQPYQPRQHQTAAV